MTKSAPYRDSPNITVICETLPQKDMLSLSGLDIVYVMVDNKFTFGLSDDYPAN